MQLQAASEASHVRCCCPQPAVLLRTGGLGCRAWVLTAHVSLRCCRSRVVVENAVGIASNNCWRQMVRRSAQCACYWVRETQRRADDVSYMQRGEHTRKLLPKLVRVARAVAGPRTLRGNTSPTISQLIGPKLSCMHTGGCQCSQSWRHMHAAGHDQGQHIEHCRPMSALDWEYCCMLLLGLAQPIILANLGGLCCSCTLHSALCTLRIAPPGPTSYAHTLTWYAPT